jgi:2-polyprenyl-6-hydroxyphenyl methylase/3-demethylubiquinone-9 3-methyltransferase
VSDSANLTDLRSHFAFGENWSSYAEKIREEEIAEAVKGLMRLCGGRLEGQRFLDIGCGSGVHSLAALQLGAAEVVCVDIDPVSVATTKRVLARHYAGAAFRVEQVSVFDLDPRRWGQFDIVYSWGVLHHTGDMYRALRSACALVRPGGAFVVALYRRTWMCWLWRLEKRWYARASKRGQGIASATYLWLLARKLGSRYEAYVNTYRSLRGMNFHNDVHDWLGGYPYESITPEETERFMVSLGFKGERVFASKGPLFGRHIGFFGSACNEYVYVRSR